MNVEDVTKLWQEKYPKSLPRSEDFKEVYSSRWVRFHYLPESKRYPENEAEYRKILARHSILLRELSSEQPLLIVACEWTESPTNYENKILPNSTHWQSFAEKSSEDLETISYRHLFINTVTAKDPELEKIFREVANDEIGGVIIMPSNLSWLYCPYDGGVDIILASEDERDALKQKHPEWLSDHPEGL